MKAGMASSERIRRLAWWTLGITAVVLLVWQASAASGGVPDPTDPEAKLSHGAVVVDSALLVFREGLEAILVLAAVTASFLGANRAYRRPVAAGAGVALAVSVATWFAAVWLIGALGGPGLEHEKRIRVCAALKPHVEFRSRTAAIVLV